MVLHVSDTASNRRDQIANFAEVLRAAPARQRVLRAVYHGKRATKTVADVAKATGCSPKRVTVIAKRLAREHLFEQARERVGGTMQTVYRKSGFVENNKHEILRLATKKDALNQYHTKTNPRSSRNSRRVVIAVPFRPKTEFITIDRVDQFKKVHNSSKTTNIPGRLPEERIKRGIVRLLGEPSIPKDWGGEVNDIFTTKVSIGGRRLRAAFALKGPAKKGPLVPGMMGKNGDQIQRLFDSPADVFFVQYEDEIKQSVIQLMQQLATARALLAGKVWYGVIDGDDTRRLRLAYPDKF